MSARRLQAWCARAIWPVAAVVAVFAAPAFAQSQPAASAAAAAATMPAAEYELGPGDVLKITVFQNLDLTTEARVSENGTISFPLIGQVRVAGLTTQRVERLMAQRLKDGNFVAQAQVTVNIMQYRSQQVSVLGSVGRPGRYPIELRGTRLTEVLAQAGGIAPTGGDTVIVMRIDGARSGRFEIDLPSLYLKGKPELDMTLQGGDSIYVHRAPQFYIFGQVQRPGNYQVERDMTVSQAIAKGGGFTLRARQGGIVLKRRDAKGNMVEAASKADDAVQPDDQIFVQESLF
jgi:polysaccharide biosynthesis/export protein